MMSVFFLTELDAAKAVVELGAKRSGIAVFRDNVGAVVFRVIDALYRADYGKHRLLQM